MRQMRKTCMTLRDELTTAQNAALKARQTQTLSTLRMTLAAVKNVEIDKRRALSDEEIQQVIRTQVKQLKDALIDFEKGKREDLVSQTRAEIELLTTYLPAQVSDEELQTIVARVVEEEGAKSVQDVGRVMGAVMKEVRGLADGDRVRQVVMRQLG